MTPLCLAGGMAKPSGIEIVFTSQSVLFLLAAVLILHLVVWSNDVQIPLWNSVLAKTPVAEYPLKRPVQWFRQVDDQIPPSSPLSSTS